MVVIDEFDEWFYFASLGDSFLAHSRGDFTGIALDSCYESMAKGVYFGSIVVWFEDDSFATCVAATGDESDFAGFQD